jgi:hypothetical protein
MKRGAKKLLICLFIYSLVFTFSVGSASANHYVWLIHDGNKQKSAFSGYEALISYWLMIGTYTYWTATDSTADTHGSTAIANWNNAIPEVKFKRYDSYPDLTLSVNDNSCASTTGGCYKITEIYTDSTRDVNYSTKGEAISGSQGSDKKNIFAHEIGHYFGFHEQYYDDGTKPKYTCNDNVITIMDSSNCDNLQGPSSTDVSRFKNFLGYGYADNIQALKVSSVETDVTWKDRSHGENYYEAKWYKKNSDGTYSLQTTQTIKERTGLVAGINGISDRTIIANRSDLSSGVTYKVVVTPYFESFKKYGLSRSVEFTH